MSIIKTVGVIGAISGIGLIGYYYLNKTKPNIAEKQAEEIKGLGMILIEDKPAYRNIWAIIAQYGYDNIDFGRNNRYIDIKNKILRQDKLVISNSDYDLLNTSLSSMNDKGILEKLIGSDNSKIDISLWQFVKRTKGLEGEWFDRGFGSKTNCGYDPTREQDPCGYSFTPLPSYSSQDNNFDNYFKYAPNESNDYFWALPNPSGKDIRIKASNCVEIDQDLKRIVNRIADQTRNNPNAKLTAILQWYKAILEDYSSLHSCRDKIENQRLLDMAKTETLSSISQENSVLGKNTKEQNLYLGIGALVLVASVGILASSGAKTDDSTPSISSNKNSGLGILSDLVIFGGLAGIGYLIFKKPKVVLANEKNK